MRSIENTGLRILGGSGLVAAVLLVAGCQEAPTSPETTAVEVRTSAVPAASCQNVQGTMFLNFTGPASAAGTVSGNLSGTVTVSIVGMDQSGEGATHLMLMHEITTDEGTIETSDEGILSPVSPPLFRVNVRYAVTGGTDAFDDARGRIHTHGDVDFAAGTIDLAYQGRICTG